MINVLWLASWYPNRTDIFTGDFIERHAIAVSAFVKLTVLVVIKDDLLKAGEVEMEKTESINLIVYKVYYGISKLGGPVEKILSLNKYLQLQKKLYRQIIDETGKPAIIHVQVAMKAGMLARWLKKRASIPFLVTEHWSVYNPESRPNIYEMNWLFRQLNKKILQEAALLLPVSDALGQMINQHFIVVPYQPLPNVVNTNLFFYQPALPAPKKFRFIHPSSMNYSKNPEGILAACKIIKEKGFDFDVLMIGSKDEDLVSLANQFGLKDMLFFEAAVSYEEVARQMQLSSALLLFSRYENLPCVLLEALCCGLPAVSSSVGGIGEVINESNGILVQPNNVEQLAAAMIRMIETYILYNRAAIAKQATALYNYDTVGRQYLNVYLNYV
jgi:glycosyltransferase involved in cell wall biosynthesis